MRDLLINYKLSAGLKKSRLWTVLQVSVTSHGGRIRREIGTCGMMEKMMVILDNDMEITEEKGLS